MYAANNSSKMEMSQLLFRQPYYLYQPLQYQHLNRQQMEQQQKNSRQTNDILSK